MGKPFVEPVDCPPPISEMETDCVYINVTEMLDLVRSGKMTADEMGGLILSMLEGN